MKKLRNILNCNIKKKRYVEIYWEYMAKRGLWRLRYINIHFENYVSLREKNAHIKLKKHLEVSRGDLRLIKDKICLVIENEFQEIKTVSNEKLKISHVCKHSFF